MSVGVKLLDVPMGPRVVIFGLHDELNTYPPA
jgi:hypothetical protein